MPRNKYIAAFDAIVEFVDELDAEFATSQHGLVLYARLLHKTTHADTVPVRKHIDAFHTWFLENHAALTAQDATKLYTASITYSLKVHIDMRAVFAAADAHTTDVVWRHLLTIYGIIDPASGALEILRTPTSVSVSTVATVEGSDSAAVLLQPIVAKIKGLVRTDTTDPMQAMMEIVQSGALAEVISEISAWASAIDTTDMRQLTRSILAMVRDQSDADTPEIDADALDSLIEMFMSGGLENGGFDIASLIQDMMAGSSSADMASLLSDPTVQMLVSEFTAAGTGHDAPYASEEDVD